MLVLSRRHGRIEALRATIAVDVKPCAGLAAEHSLRDHAPLDVHRRKPLLSHTSVDRLRRRQIDVQPDEVHQFEGPHAKAGSSRQRVELFD